jgi:hypothetical protein
MDNEIDLLHLLSQHQIILFAIGALLLVAVMLGIGIFIGNRMERKRQEHKR